MKKEELHVSNMLVGRVVNNDFVPNQRLSEKAPQLSTLYASSNLDSSSDATSMAAQSPSDAMVSTQLNPSSDAPPMGANPLSSQAPSSS